MAVELGHWRRLVEPAAQPLLEHAAAIDPTDVSAVARLRRRWDKPLVDAALQLTAARRKAAGKFGERADRLVADPEGIEQASGATVARYKAQRLCEAEGGVVVDLACGIGGDAMGLVEAGVGVLAVDRDPLRAWMASRNAGCPAAATDVMSLALEGRLCHLDPSRRSEAGRSRSMQQSVPAPEVIEVIRRQCAGLALKLSPAVDAAELPWAGELEFISDGGRLVQAVLWTRALAGVVPNGGHHEPAPSRRATRVNGERITTLEGEPGPAPLGRMGRYLFTVEPAVERAGLMGSLCERHGIVSVHPSLGLLTGDEPVESDWLTGFELLAQMPWRLKHVRQWLRDNGGGLVEVKTRGRAVDPDRVQQQLRGDGDTPYTVFIMRWDQTRYALITRRV